MSQETSDSIPTMPQRIPAKHIKQLKVYLDCTLKEILGRPNPAYQKLENDLREAEIELEARMKFEDWAETFYDAKINHNSKRFGMLILDPYTVFVGTPDIHGAKIIAVSEAWKAYLKHSIPTKPEPTGLDSAIEILQTSINNGLHELGYKPDTGAFYKPNPILLDMVDAMRNAVQELRRHGGARYQTPEYEPDHLFNIE